MNIQKMRARWLALCVRHGAWSPIAESVWEKIEHDYTEAWRFYHTLEHIEALLDEFDTVRHMAQDPDAIEFAIWFHDIVYKCYDPRAKDNEEQSADVAVAYIHKMFGHLDTYVFGWLDSCYRLKEKVRKLILATKHASEPIDPDERLLVDIDLSILGRDTLAFERYEAQIAEEYTPRPYSLDAYKKGRVELVLKPFLARDRIFYTDHYFRKFELRARENLRRSIERLSS